MTANGWQGILDADERILWQGRPGTRLRFPFGQLALTIFGIFFAGFALFWMILAASAGGFFWMFGLIHFTVGLALALGAPFYDRYRRAHTWYTLTDRRAFIATDLPLAGRRLRSYPIAAGTPIELEEGTPGSVFFASEYRQGRNSSRRVSIGFERIAEAEDVYRLMRKAQRGEA